MLLGLGSRVVEGGSQRGGGRARPWLCDQGYRDGARQHLSGARESVDRGHHERHQALDAVDPQRLLQVERPAPDQHLPRVAANGGGVRPPSANAPHVSRGESRHGCSICARGEVAMAKRAQETFAVRVDVERALAYLRTMMLWPGRE